jgi:hypothetical protein
VSLLVVETKASVLQSFVAQLDEFCLTDPSQILKIVERLLIGEKIFVADAVIPCPITSSAHGLC